jgi:Tfp pilus assembly protein PilN
MRTLRLDFVERRRQWPAWLMLGVGAVLLADAALEHTRLAEEVDELQQRLRGPRKERKVVQERLSDEKQLEFNQARRVLQQLSLPWEHLLRSIEQTVNRDTALLSIEPDAEHQQLQMVGEARHYGAVLDFVDRLSRTPGLERVHLVSHEVRADVPERPLQFTLAATWKVAP